MPWFRCAAVLLVLVGLEAVPLQLSAVTHVSKSHESHLGGGGTFVIHDNSFFLDGLYIQIVSAEVHYFRIPQALWRDRLQRVAAMGFNAVQIYVPWNYHEPKKGVIDMSHDHDVVLFLELAQSLDLLVLLRPGPYICAEWEFGGLPAWLLENENTRLRTFETGYIKHVTEWFDILLPRVQKLLYSNGGPIIMVQVENEFGSFGHVDANASDRKYMLYLISLFRRHLGNDVILYTTDFGNLDAMLRGSINGSEVLTAGDFGPDGDFQASAAAQMQMNAPGQSPPFCSEFYSGWFTKWGQPAMSNKTGGPAEETIAKMLREGFSVNVYMGHGGTNFGFWGGANTVNNSDPESYAALITSYDYSAPVTEWGEHSVGPDGEDKFEGMARAIRGHAPPRPMPEPPTLPRAAYGPVALPWRAGLWDLLPALAGPAVAADSPLPFEQVGAQYGFVLYRAEGVRVGPGAAVAVSVSKLRDRAHVLLNRTLLGVLLRGHNASAELPVPTQLRGGEGVLEVLVESMGRVNYGPFLADRKGITEHVTVNGQEVRGWTMTPLPLSSLPADALHAASQHAASGMEEGPAFFQGDLHVAPGARGDTFLRTAGWGKGYVWVNGFNLGMYWETAGPQHALYLPACLLRDGPNRVTVLELDVAHAVAHPYILSTASSTDGVAA